MHSKLRMPAAEMTPRMVAAIANPHTDVLGHCTGRMVTGNRHRPPSDFDAEVVFAACEAFGVAVEINSRPERLDPPKRLLRLAIEAGCLVSIDTDAHAPGPARVAALRLRAGGALRDADRRPWSTPGRPTSCWPGPPTTTPPARPTAARWSAPG